MHNDNAIHIMTRNCHICIHMYKDKATFMGLVCSPLYQVMYTRCHHVQS